MRVGLFVNGVKRGFSSKCTPSNSGQQSTGVSPGWQSMLFVLRTNHFARKIWSRMSLWIGSWWHQMSTHRVAQKNCRKKTHKNSFPIPLAFSYWIWSHLHIKILELSFIDYWLVALWVMELGTNIANCEHRHTDFIKYEQVCSRMNLREDLTIKIHQQWMLDFHNWLQRDETPQGCCMVQKQSFNRYREPKYSDWSLLVPCSLHGSFAIRSVLSHWLKLFTFYR